MSLRDKEPLQTGLALKQRLGTVKRFDHLIEVILGSAPWQAIRESWIAKEAHDWIQFTPKDALLADQGWKLHISAPSGHGATVLEACLPILFDARVPFKCCPSEAALVQINGGSGGLSQIGKFITVYPPSEAMAVTIAAQLDAATRHFQGPEIRSDLRYSKGSSVYYRYGAFTGKTMRLASGARLPAIFSPEGIPQHDLRRSRIPSWVSNPFPPIDEQLDWHLKELEEQFVLLAKIDSSPNSVVALALELPELLRCVVKIAKRGDAADEQGEEAYARLLREARILDLLQGNLSVPIMHKVIEKGDLAILCLEDLGNNVLSRYTRDRHVEVEPPSDDEVIKLGVALARGLACIHAVGYVFGDLKPNNVVIEDDRGPVLIDFGSCTRIGSEDRVCGTVGFMSPEQSQGLPADERDDVFSLGSTLYHFATGIDPSRESSSMGLCPLEINAPDRHPLLIECIGRCRAPGRADRFASAQKVIEFLEGMDPDIRTRDSLKPVLTKIDPLHEIEQLADAIVASAIETNNGVCWASQGWFGPERPNLDVNAGTAGTILALLDSAQILGRKSDRQMLENGAKSLMDSPDEDRLPVSGLMVGECGIGYALLKSGLLLRDRKMIGRAVEIAQQVEGTPHYTEDLFCGTAGRIKFFLHMHKNLPSNRYLQVAQEWGDWIVTRARNEGRGIYWNVKSDIAGEEVSALLGYAHGAAGIADALLDLFEFSGEERFLRCAESAWESLLSYVVWSGNRDGKVAWPVFPGGPLAGPFWCHGTAGILKFAVHLSKLNPNIVPIDLLRSIGRTLSHGGKWSEAVLCHGLAGSIDCLLDLFELTEDEEWVRAANDLAHIMSFQKLEEGSYRTCPDYMVGYGGVLTCFARMGGFVPSAISICRLH